MLLLIVGSTVPSPAGSANGTPLASKRASLAKGKVNTMVPIVSGTESITYTCYFSVPSHGESSMN